MTLPQLTLNRLTPVPATWDPVFLVTKKRPSAVLVLLIEDPTAAVSPLITLIRRSTRVGSHRGQIGFPGGRLEQGDASPASTALRESGEELGIDASKVKILGGLPALPALDGTLVFPVVGVIARADCSMNPSEKEVQQVHCVPWTLICSPNQKKFSFNMFGCWRDSFLYDCQEFTIWGLSAEILATANF